ncbi:hypothetical protein GCM10012275_53510 [Longimycelium tulufanense]|uniref:DinB family protein n=1 Tax=Longimycelium tulufanense TaxID=907463 RepID=A0A8J3FYI1_9PSEU|nr:DinB family protein [Longimycelium tulufanense]GGM76097.1 hypothetical protein GCM10012275_53510 [Longimycelium tulufanense]
MSSLSGERATILRILAEQRDLLLITVRGIGDEEATQRTTVSDLTLAGIVKHLTACERTWAHIVTERDGNPPGWPGSEEQYRMGEGETLASLVADYTAAARETEEAVATLTDLDRVIQLPAAPWWPEPPAWSIRFILLHLLRETAHHCGHADIIREALDGANTTRSMTGEASITT